MQHILLSLILIGLGCKAVPKQLVVDFYDQKLVIAYNENILHKKKYKVSEENLKKFYVQISKSDYKPLLDSLQVYRSRFQLNDYLYYSLIVKVCDALEKRRTNASYLKWFLLGKSDYKSRVTFWNDHLLIWLESEELVSGLRKLEKSYCINCGDLIFTAHGLSRWNPFQNNKEKFSFFFSPLPTFPKTNYVSKIFSLRLSDTTFRDVEVKFDTILIKCLNDLAGFNMFQTFSVPLSESSKGLLHQISEILQDYNDSMKVEYITRFVKNNSIYKADERNFGKEKWMTPEEYLYYDAADCEDRSSFLYYALKEILKKPLVIIDYPNVPHVNIGISLDLKSQPNFYYKNKPYYICEPTVIGRPIPLGTADSIKNAKYKIIGEYVSE